MARRYDSKHVVPPELALEIVPTQPPSISSLKLSANRPDAGSHVPGSGPVHAVYWKYSWPMNSSSVKRR